MLQQLVQKIRRDANLSDLLRHSGVMYASGLVSTVLIIVQQITTAAVIGAEDYGRFATVVGSGALIFLIMDVRTWEIGTKLLARPILDRQHEEINRVTNWLTLADVVTGSLSAVAILILAPFIAGELLHAPELTWLVQLYGISSPFRMLANGIARTVLRMYDYFGWLSWKSIAYGVARIVLISGAALLGLGLPGVVLGAIIAEVIGGAMLWAMAYIVRRREASNSNLWDLTRPQQFNEGLKMLRGLWLSATLAGLQVETFIPLLALLTTPEQVGLFRSGLDIAEMVEKFTYPFGLVLFPQVMRSYQQNTRREFLQLIQQSSLIMALITLPFVVAIFALGPLVLPHLLGQEYAGVSFIAGSLALGYAVFGILLWTRPTLIAINQVPLLNFISLFLVVVGSILLFTLVPVYGAAAGAAIRGGIWGLQSVLAWVFFQIRWPTIRLPNE